jgi:AmmeMemoRadiSam system protein B
MIGIKAMLNVAKDKNLSVDLLDYRTSADASSDESRVVGYISAYFK